MVRRVITGHNAAGKSCFVADEIVDDMTLWQSLPGMPLGAGPDGGAAALLPTSAPGIEPPPGGSKCVLVSMKPWQIMKPELERGDIPGLDADGFHRTATVDYIILVSGEVTLALEAGETVIRAGDLVVQRNTLHAWHNHTDEPVVFWGVMSSVATTAP
jgi:mannose-6-phosphate isomerase-like protein (cupin superfamily)